MHIRRIADSTVLLLFMTYYMWNFTPTKRILQVHLDRHRDLNKSEDVRPKRQSDVMEIGVWDAKWEFNFEFDEWWDLAKLLFSFTGSIQCGATHL